ncbi:unnamed protein product [Effrenium voratum]|nr:unnamed protein product [Effrenium voratum]
MYGRNERTGKMGWFSAMSASSFLERGRNNLSSSCKDTLFSDWGSSGMKIYYVHSGEDEFLQKVKNVKLPLTAKSEPSDVGAAMAEYAQELNRNQRYLLRNGWEILSTAGHRVEVANARRLFEEIQRLGDLPVTAGGLGDLLYKCSKRLNEDEGCRTLPGSLEAVYEMGAFLISLGNERSFRRITSQALGFVSAGGASLQIGITSPNASHSQLVRQCIEYMDAEVKVEETEDTTHTIYDELPGDTVLLDSIQELPPRSRRGPSLASVAHFPGGQPVGVFSFLAMGKNPGPCEGLSCAHEVGGVNEMRLQFENFLSRNNFTSNPCVERAADFPLRAGTAAYTQTLPGSAEGTDADKEECGEVVNQFLDSDPTLQKWMSAESGCRDIASAVEDWGLLSSFSRVRSQEKHINWCSGGGPFKHGKMNCGAVLTQILLDEILVKVGVRDAQFKESDAGWEASVFGLRGLSSGVCFHS